MKQSAELLQDDLNALHSRRAFITSGNDIKSKEYYAIILVRKSGEVKYVRGDSVFYKREDKNGWPVPGVINGQVNQQIFV